MGQTIRTHRPAGNDLYMKRFRSVRYSCPKSRFRIERKLVIFIWVNGGFVWVNQQKKSLSVFAHSGYGEILGPGSRKSWVSTTFAIQRVRTSKLVSWTESWHVHQGKGKICFIPRKKKFLLKERDTTHGMQQNVLQPQYNNNPPMTTKVRI